MLFRRKNQEEEIEYRKECVEARHLRWSAILLQGGSAGEEAERMLEKLK